MFGVENNGSTLDDIAHIIQVALTPVFLLSGIATLLNVFSTRLSRVADRVEAASKDLEGADEDDRKILSAQLKDLHRRSVVLDVAVVLSAVGGAATCAAVLVLFLGALREATIANALFGLFGLAVVCALCAIAAFAVEMLLAGTGIRAEVAHRRREAAEDRAGEAPEPHQGSSGGDGNSGAGS
jgi:uncharacterized membrane protein YdbT with pleckstrin-like domain